MQITWAGSDSALAAPLRQIAENAGLDGSVVSEEVIELEGSKGFTKDLCARADIPTAAYVRTEKMDEAIAALDKFGCPVVVKADGLAAAGRKLEALSEISRVYEAGVQAFEKQ